MTLPPQPRQFRPAALLFAAWLSALRPVGGARLGLRARGRLKGCHNATRGFPRIDLRIDEIGAPCDQWGSKDDRLQQVENVGDTVQDFETRMKPPFVDIPAQETGDRLTPQQRRGVEGIFDTNPEDFRNCMLVHMNAQPLEVVDALHMEDPVKGTLTKEGPDSEEEDWEEVMCRPGMLFDDKTTTKDGVQELHVSTKMFARLEGITNPVQLIPTGIMSSWHSLWKVPVAGFLCLGDEQSDSAPVLYATPTPCVPTTLDAEGNALNPATDGYEVWIGTTRLAFPNKSMAEALCEGFVEEVGGNLEIVDWDVEAVGSYFRSGGAALVIRDNARARAVFETSSAPDSGSASARPLEANNSEAPLDSLAANATAANATAGDAKGSAPATNATAEDAPKALPKAPPGPDTDADSAASAEAKLAFLSGRGLDVDAPASLVTPESPSLPEFLKLAAQRSTPAGWTKGKKKLLVVIMDWKNGDKSMSPYSQQMNNPVPVYKNKIVPAAVKALREMSYGQLQLTATVIPEVVRYTHIRAKMTGKLPFPTLYERARDAVQGHPKFGQKYKFKEFNFVFVIAPQVNPVGTKGVAWVGSRGAVCNGCETLSDSRKIMVMVHELGHNLGLSHASSDGLDYGNIFDWMGNSPDVQGLTYGVGYVLSLGWITPSNILQVTDKNVGGVNDLVTLMPFDQKKPSNGQIVGIKISLRKNSDDIYVSFRRHVSNAHRGVFITYQDKHSPNSRLMDAGCHTLSQQDAAMEKGWVFIDSSQTVAVSVRDINPGYAQVQVWKTPSKAENIAMIRSRPGFTDGKTKCPVTCQDSDLIMSYTCAELKKKGFCSKPGGIKVQGKKLQIATDLCPQTCNKCNEVLKQTPLEMGKSTCMDKAVKISGMNCAQMAKKDVCGMKTTAGKVIGRDFCPQSCGKCPKEPPPPNKGGGWQTDPKPKRTVGFVEMDDAGEVAPLSGPNATLAAAAEDALNATVLSADQALAVEEQEQEAHRLEQLVSNASGGAAAGHASRAGPDTSGCEDDPLWTDVDGSSCEVYAASIPKMGIEEVCKKHNGGQGEIHCRKTCSNCKGADGRCTDNVCIEHWMDKYGVCYQCADFAKMCNDPEAKDWFVQECPLTCGVCSVDVGVNFHYNSTARDYDDSVKYCDSKKLVIASIRSWDEQKEAEEMIREQDGSGAYLGGTSNGRGEWKWADGAPWKTVNPENDGLRGRKETRLAMSRSGKWHDTDGRAKLGVLCREKTEPCEDDDPVLCSMGMAFCTERPFKAKCKSTCNVCSPLAPAKQECTDNFDTFTCTRYKTYGWCTRMDTQDQVRQNCMLTCGACPGDERLGVLGKLGELRRRLCDKSAEEVERAKKAMGSSGIRTSPACLMIGAATALLAAVLQEVVA